MEIGLGGFFLGLVSGVLASLIVVLALGVLRAPRLHLEIGGSVDGAYPSGTYRFVHVRVSNRGWRLWQWQLRRPATMCRAVVAFGDLGSTVPRFSIDGRWTSQPEPLQNTSTGAVLDMGAVLTIPRENVNPGDEVELAIALKRDGTSDCAAFNNRSYLFPNWSNPAWILDPGTYWVKVVVTSGEVQTQRSFHLVNSGSAAAGLHLEPAPL